MPIYEYRCVHCAAEFEELVRSSTRDDEIACPACGQHQSQRKLSTFAARTGGSSSNMSSASAGCGGSSGFS